jgi:hypothetical protein
MNHPNEFEFAPNPFLFILLTEAFNNFWIEYLYCSGPRVLAPLEDESRLPPVYVAFDFPPVEYFASPLQNEFLRSGIQATILVLLAVREPRLSQRDWDWRLSFFEKLPSHISETSKTILHHWARCLYLSAAADNVSNGERRVRVERAISKLNTAISLPRRKSRDEVPSHLYNTLGTAYGRLADFHDEHKNKPEADAAWLKACAAFRESIDIGWGANLDTLLGFSDRLVRHARVQLEKNRAEAAANDLATALSMLDEAAQVLADAVGIDVRKEQDTAGLRSAALDLLGSELASEYVRGLKDYTNSDLGYYCEAQLASEKNGSEGGYLVDDPMQFSVRIEKRTGDPPRLGLVHKLNNLYPNVWHVAIVVA